MIIGQIYNSFFNFYIINLLRHGLWGEEGVAIARTAFLHITRLSEFETRRPKTADIS